MTEKSFQRDRFRAIKLSLAMALGALAILALPSLAAAKDRNHDRIPDRWEKHHRLSLNVKQTKRDQDRDGLKNLGEYQNRTNPRDADTDNDGLEDGAEVEVGDDPANDDSDNDGVEDGSENAGTIASFDGTTLTIDLAVGGSVSGQVTDQTEVECDNHGSEHSGHEGSGSHSDRIGAGDENGDHQSGDDDGDEGDHQSGDDDGDDEGNGSSCTADDLLQGATVHEADLHLGGDGAIFDKIELEPATA